MTHRRNIPGAALSILGGFFILLGGIAFALLGALFAVILGRFSALFLLGITLGLAVIVLGILMLAVPYLTRLWGGLVVILAFVSLPFTLLGLIVGFILALLGGLIALFHRQPRELPTTTTGVWVCGHCGGAVDLVTRHCGQCGRPAT